MLITKETFEM